MTLEPAKEGPRPDPFLQFLEARAALPPEALQAVLARHHETGQPTRDILVEQGLLPDVEVSQFLAGHLRLPYVDVSGLTFSTEQLNLVPEVLARRHLALPLRREGKRLELVMADPQDLEATRDLAFATGCRIEPRLGSPGQLRDAIERAYTRHLEGAGALLAAGAELSGGDSIFSVLGREASELDAKGVDAPVIQLLNLIMRKAIQMGASDIHIEPGHPEGTVRFRLDGLLHDQLQVPSNLHPALVSRLKILGRMDIAERRMPQDGSVRVKLEGREADLRLSTIPLRGGEKAVIRILDASQGGFELDGIGFLPKDLRQVEGLIRRHMGMVIMTGPTGSGKTTTLYSMLNRIKNRDINIVTVEDPIEYNYPGLNQMQVHSEIDLTFSRGLRAILRQDPDVILVGEIRDAETAEIACRAALTGHLVFTTQHTNDAPSSITRLVDIGVPRYLVASVLIGVISQRLVRRVCPSCQVAMQPDDESIAALGLAPAALEGGDFRVGLGCSRCHDLGYRGRLGVFETLVMDSRIRDLVLRGASEEDIRLAAQEAGMRTILEDGLAKAKTGQTTLEELWRVLEVGEFAAKGCPGCGRLLNHEYHFCPYCQTPQRRMCSACGRTLHQGWKACAYCGAASAK
jgi:type II secretory ATPase GspE/PulE/Tfp pilus assembly ATPase PilB-like protein